MIPIQRIAEEAGIAFVGRRKGAISHSLALWVFVVFGLMALTGCSPSRAYESALALADAVGGEQARAYLIHRILGHVDLSLAHILSWPFWSEELPDARPMRQASGHLSAAIGAGG